MKVDNFDLIRSHLTFEPATKFDSDTSMVKMINDTYDRYIVQILCRAKDAGGKKHGVNTSNRPIKTYEISSLEYFDRKRDHIIDLCESNKARAYILPQVRSTYDCLKEMIKIGIDNLENPTVKFQHILRSALCSMHRSRDKKWIIDLDDDCMTEYIYHVNYGGATLHKKVWTTEDVMKIVRDNLVSCGKNPDDAYVVPTRSGSHIITPPFNLADAVDKCGMLFEGEKTFVVDRKAVGPGEYETVVKKLTGWLHKDGMTLLYCPEF